MLSAIYLFGTDAKFDREEQEANSSMVCTVQVIRRELNLMDPGLLVKESSKDPVILQLCVTLRKGGPL